MEPRRPLEGRYRLDERIGAGGMGEVWRGLDLRLERPVAVKLLRRGLFGDSAVSRFQREAKLLASLKGPGFVEVYDSGECEIDGETARYIVMELVEGGSLRDLLDRHGRLAPADAARYAAEAADALDAAHRGHLVHRDVKPANLLVDAADRVRVVDFGISKRPASTRYTPAEAILGTPDYIAPEQYEGAPATDRSDQYALGLLTYECLTGRLPFDAESRGALIRAHLLEPPEPLPDTVPEPLAAAVMRALAKDPDDRWPSCAAFAAACRDAVAAAAPATAPPPEPPEATRTPTGDTDATLLTRPLKAPVRKRRGRAAIALAAVLAVLVAGSLAAWRLWPSGDGGPGTVGGTTGVEAAPEPTASGGATAEATETPTGATESPAPDRSPTGDATTTEDGTDDDDPGPGPGATSASASAEDDPPPGSTEVLMPNYSGDLRQEAETDLGSRGFTNVEYVQEYVHSRIPEECEVTAQFPAAGTVVDPAAEITIEYFPGWSGSLC